MEQEGTYKWVQDRLRDLHSGTLSEADRLRLTEIGKTDPFVQDALEGYNAHEDHDHSSLLKVLSQRIENKSTKRHAKILPLSRGIVLQAVAASLVLILATWSVIYYVSKDDQNATLATQTEVLLSTDSVMEMPAKTSTSAAEDIAADDIAANEVVIEKTQPESSGLRANAQSRAKEHAENTQETNKKEDNLSDGGTLVTPGEPSGIDLQLDPDVALQNVPASATQVEKDMVADEYKADYSTGAGVTNKTLSHRDEGSYANAMSPGMMSKRVVGQVLDVNIEPVIGATVNVSSTTLSTSTDLYGRFELFIPQAQAILEASQTGYENTMISAIQGQEDLVILLNEGQPLPPAAVISNDAHRKQYIENRANLQGTSSFVNYIFTYSQFPLATVYSPAVKEVNLEFRVDSKHRTDHIKVIRSSGDKKFELEAIRLIKDGPNWVCDDGVYPCVREFTFFFE